MTNLIQNTSIHHAYNSDTVYLAKKRLEPDHDRKTEGRRKNEYDQKNERYNRCNDKLQAPWYTQSSSDTHQNSARRFKYTGNVYYNTNKYQRGDRIEQNEASNPNNWRYFYQGQNFGGKSQNVEAVRNLSHCEISAESEGKNVNTNANKSILNKNPLNLNKVRGINNCVSSIISSHFQVNSRNIWNNQSNSNLKNDFISTLEPLALGVKNHSPPDQASREYLSQVRVEDNCRKQLQQIVSNKNKEKMTIEKQTYFSPFDFDPLPREGVTENEVDASVWNETEIILPVKIDNKTLSMLLAEKNSKNKKIILKFSDLTHEVRLKEKEAFSQSFKNSNEIQCNSTKADASKSYYIFEDMFKFPQENVANDEKSKQLRNEIFQIIKKSEKDILEKRKVEQTIFRLRNRINLHNVKQLEIQKRIDEISWEY